MRRVDRIFGMGALLAVTAAGLGQGCTAPLSDCSKYAHVGCPGYGGSGTGGEGAGGAAADAGGDAGCTGDGGCPDATAGP